MGMTNNNLCNSCTNIRCIFQSGMTECASYMSQHLEPDSYGNYIGMQPTVDVIPKADYEQRLKTDLEAMLTELQLEIEEIVNEEELINKNWARGLYYSEKIIQQKIDKLKENANK